MYLATLLFLAHCSSRDGALPAPIASPHVSARALAYGFFEIRESTSGSRGIDTVGTVLDVGVGDARARLDPGRIQRELRLGNGDSAEASWLHIESVDGRESWVTLTAPGFVLQSQPGDVVRVAAYAEYYGLYGQFELRYADRNLLFWYGVAGNVAALNAPAELELTLNEGALQVEVGSECVPLWAQKQLRVDLAGATASIGYGEQLALDGWLISNVGIDVLLSQTRCTDGAGGAARAALWPLP
ncbi:MAG TPA: hypothetical protein VJU61_02635 [Polyangiaceae bacterium]|nr:hypothetical protein [Polyangiaceae bacterium]